MAWRATHRDFCNVKDRDLDVADGQGAVRHILTPNGSSAIKSHESSQICLVVSIKGDGKPRGIENKWAGLPLNIARAAFVIPAKPGSSHLAPITFAQLLRQTTAIL